MSIEWFPSESVSSWLMGNSAGALVIALVAMAFHRWLHRPAIAHRLWILAILKLLLPPISMLPMTIETPASPTAILLLGRWGTTITHTQAHVAPVLLGLWVAGSVVMAGWIYRSAIRVRQLLEYRGRFDVGATGRLHDCVKVPSQDVQKQKLPEVWLVDAFISPMLYWPPRSWISGKPIILFPRRLWDRFDDSSKDVLLKHELAHWSRHDQVVRAFEVIALVILWWHPLLWIARRQIESCEEQCCDAEATSGSPSLRRTYAEAILKTLDFISEPLEHSRRDEHNRRNQGRCREMKPRPLATGLGHLPIVRHRLQKIMQPGVLVATRSRLTQIATNAAAGSVAVLILALPMAPHFSLRLISHPQPPVATNPILSTQSTVDMDLSSRSSRHPHQDSFGKYSFSYP